MLIQIEIFLMGFISALSLLWHSMAMVALDFLTGVSSWTVSVQIGFLAAA